MSIQKELYLITPSFNDKHLITIEKSIIKYNNLTMIQLRDKSASITN